MTTRSAFWFAILALIFVSAARRQVADLDMYHQMALIREALATGAIPREDVFSFTPTVSPSVHHEWGAGALLYGVSVATGWGGGGVLLLRYLLLVGIVAFAYAAARKRGGNGTLMALCAPIAILMFGPGLVTLRAHMYTFFFVALLLLLLERDRQGDRRWIAIWLPAYVVWLNLHGGFVAGVGLFGVYLLERLWDGYRAHGGLRSAVRETRHLLLTLAAMGPLVLFNPYGIDYVPFLWESILLDRPMIDEWAPLWSDRAFTSFKLGFPASLLFLAYAVVRRGVDVIPRTGFVLLAGIAAVGAQRIVPIYAIVWFATLPGLLAGTDLKSVLDRLVESRLRPVLVAIALLVGIGLTGRSLTEKPWRMTVPGFSEDRPLYYPVGAVDYLAAAGFTGNLMTEFGAGSYVSWRLHPNVRVGMDSRYEAAYRPELADEIFRFYAGEPGWEEVLRRYPADAILVRVSRPLDELLENSETSEADSQWSRVYRDDAFSLFVSGESAKKLPIVDRRGERIDGDFP